MAALGLLARVLIRLDTDLRAIRARWALVGGLAVSGRAQPRTTQDVDVVVSVAGEEEAEGLIRSLRSRGYRDGDMVLFHKDTGRLATFRFLAPDPSNAVAPVDLLFGSSGAEPEIVEGAEAVEVLPGVAVPVAQTGHLLALKALAGRPKDLADFEALLQHASLEDLAVARRTASLISRRGFERGKDLEAELEVLLVSSGRPPLP